MSKQIMNNKGAWQDIFKYLDINDYLNMELSNKNFRTQLLTFYQLKAKLINPELQHFQQFQSKEKNFKKVFLSSYMNSLVTFSVRSEYDGYESSVSNQKQINYEDEIDKNSSNISKSSKILQINRGKLITNQHTSSCLENCLFNQE